MAHASDDRGRRHLDDVDRRGDHDGGVTGLEHRGGLDWFEVTEISGHIEEGAVAHYQVGLKIGFRLEE